MASIWLLNQVRRANRNRVIAAALAVAATLAVLAHNGNYLREFFGGPRGVSAAELVQARSPDAFPTHWVQVRAPELIDTGIQQITVRKKRGVETGRSVTAHYHVMPLEGRALLVKTESASPSLDLVGELEPMEAGVANSIFEGKDGAEMRASFAPMMLHVHDFRDNGYWLLGLSALALMAAAWWGWIAWRRLRQPETAPVAMRAAGWGPLNAVSHVVERELAQKNTVQSLGNSQLTPNHLVRTSMLGFDLHNLNQLLWAYGHVTKKKIYGIIPAGSTHALALKWADSEVLLDGKPEKVQQAMQNLIEHQPWIVFGWDEQIEAVYKKNRPDFARQVQARQAEWQAQQQSSTPQPA